MTKFYFESDMGCGIRNYPDIAAAERGIRLEVGSSNTPRRIREATPADIANVKAMGGYTE